MNQFHHQTLRPRFPTAVGRHGSWCLLPLFLLFGEWHRKFLGGDADCPPETRPYFDVYAVFCWITRHNLRRRLVSDKCALHETGRSEMGGPYRNRYARSGRADLGLHDLRMLQVFLEQLGYCSGLGAFMLCKLIRSLMSSLGDCSLTFQGKISQNCVFEPETFDGALRLVSSQLSPK